MIEAPSTFTLSASGTRRRDCIHASTSALTYWRGTRTGARSDIPGYEQQIGADIAEDAIADLSKPFERVEIETRRNLVLEDAADLRPLSGIDAVPRSERVPVGFDDWVTPPAAGADVRLPAASTRVPDAVELPKVDVSPAMRSMEAHRIDDFARKIDPEAFSARDALVAEARQRRQQAPEAAPRYEADRQAARDGAVREIERLETELRDTKGKKQRTAIRQQIQQAKSDLVEIESLRTETDPVEAAARQSIVDADQALMARMGGGQEHGHEPEQCLRAAHGAHHQRHEA